MLVQAALRTLSLLIVCCAPATAQSNAVLCWGYDGFGQTAVPRLPPGLSYVEVAAGGYHTVARRSDGSVVAWGSNEPIPVAAQSGVSAIAAGWGHSVALVIPTAPNITAHPVGQAVNQWRSASFTVVATGYPLNYQWRKDGVDLAGATSATYSMQFAQTNQAGSYTVVVSNSAGSVTSAPPAVLTVNPAAVGAVVAWGNNSLGQTTIPLAAQSGVVAIAAGGNCGLACVFGHTVALKNDGTVVAWGDNYVGQVTGTPTTDAFRSAIASPLTLGGQVLGEVTAIAAGEWHTVALKNDGTVVAWGGNGSGQVIGTPASDSTIASPVTLEGQALSGVTAITAGEWHTVALKNDGTVVAWGGNGSGQVTGTPPTEEPYYAIASPVTLGGQVLSGVTAIAAGESHTVALKNDRSVVAWGSDGSGEVTVPLAAQSGVMAIATGYRHTVALKSDGSVVSWGSLDQTTVPLAAQSGVTAIAAGGWHSVALKNDGTVVEWGDNGYLTTPVTLGGQVLSGVTAIAAGISHTVALIGGAELLPSLKARRNGNELILSWPTNTVGFKLQSTLDLTPPLTWLDSTSVPAVIGAHFTLTNTTTGGAQFCRLRKM